MSELRQNAATHEWVIIATERAKRPDEFAEERREWTAQRPERVEGCPFCPGNEQVSGPPSYAVEEDGGWVLRVLPNKFPALSAAADTERCLSGIQRRMGGFGVHEVLVESPRHNVTTALMDEAGVARTLFAFRARGLQFAHDERLLMTVFFKNHGARAGSSQEHPHCQMVATPVVPRDVRHRLNDAAQYFDERGSCPYCDMWKQELIAGERVVAESRHHVAFVPYAALSPFHTWILPKRHAPLFVQTSDEELEDLARVLRETLRRVYFGLKDPDFNYVIRTAPSYQVASRSFHWYLSIVPRVTRSAGFELGSGMFINSSLPEESARFLREVKCD